MADCRDLGEKQPLAERCLSPLQQFEPQFMPFNAIVMRNHCLQFRVTLHTQTCTLKHTHTHNYKWTYTHTRTHAHAPSRTHIQTHKHENESQLHCCDPSTALLFGHVRFLCWCRCFEVHYMMMTERLPASGTSVRDDLYTSALCHHVRVTSSSTQQTLVAAAFVLTRAS